ncbi:MAG: flagellar basal body-associated protein FliL [Desulfonatronovibrio sp.]
MAPDKKNDQEPAQETGKKKRKWLRWVILALVLLLLSGGGYFGYNYFMGPQEDQESPEEPEVDPRSTQTVELEPFVVNLADPLGRRYLRTTLQVEVVDGSAASDIERFMPRVRDSIILLLSSKSYTELDSMDKKVQLRNEIVERLNQFIGQGKVVHVYFSEFVVQ